MLHATVRHLFLVEMKMSESCSTRMCIDLEQHCLVLSLESMDVSSWSFSQHGCCGPFRFVGSREHTAQFPECFQCPQQRCDTGLLGQHSEDWALRNSAYQIFLQKCYKVCLVEKPKCVWCRPCVDESVGIWEVSAEMPGGWEKICTSIEMKHLNLVEINALLFLLEHNSSAQLVFQLSLVWL